MCGIVGLFSATLSREAREDTTRRMATCIRYRGPDSEGYWSPAGESNAPLTLGHRRLAIVDLSPTGHQPMISHSGRYAITYNGEIYNYHEIAAELSECGISMRGTSDTEVMLAAFEKWGVRVSLEKFSGMFAFGLWDQEERALTLARDRFGEKPLYYGFVGGQFVFASELKPFRISSGAALTISHDSLALLCRYNYIPAPHTIFKDVHKLEPGHLLKLTAFQLENSARIVSSTEAYKPEPYYDAALIYSRCASSRFTGSADEAVSELQTRLIESIKHQMVADVPVGAFLSGGIDSSTVVSVMQSLAGSRSIKTFSIGFIEEEYNEAPFAAQIAALLKTDHTELIVRHADALAVVPRLASMFDEPFADSSQIPTFLVAQLARQKVTVSLSGDGGDELFGGYERYRWTWRIWRLIRHIPRPLRSIIGSLIGTIPASMLDSTIVRLQRRTTSLSAFHSPGDKLLRLASLLGSRSLPELYHLLISHWSPHELQLLVPHADLNAHTTNSRIANLATAIGVASSQEWMMLVDALSYLPDDILVKVDRAAMAVSLESRVPFLDPRIVEFAWQLPETYKFRDGQTKWVLREVLKRYLPSANMERPKRGFAIPLDRWLNGPLREWARDLLDPIKMEQDGFFNPIAVQTAWEQHASGIRPRHNQLWAVLMFSAWHREFFQ